MNNEQRRTNYELKLYDLLGRELKKITTPSPLLKTGGEFKIERENLPSGMYFYKVGDKEKIIGAGKIVIE